MKRLLAYSTIAHAGYMMMPVAAAVALVGQATPAGAQRPWRRWSIYLGIYLFMNLGAFAVVAFLRNEIRSETSTTTPAWCAARRGWRSAMAVILFSLVGLPPLAGFSAKFTVFAALMTPGLLALLAIGGLNTVLSLFYYLRVVRVMVLSPEPEGPRGADDFAFLGAGGLRRRDGPDVDRVVRVVGRAVHLGKYLHRVWFIDRNRSEVFTPMSRASLAKPAATTVLNRLLRIIARSLPMYWKTPSPGPTVPCPGPGSPCEPGGRSARAGRSRRPGHSRSGRTAGARAVSQRFCRPQRLRPGIFAARGDGEPATPNSGNRAMCG